MFLHNKKFISILCILFTLSLLSGCSKDSSETTTNEPIKKSELMMGTVISVTLYDKKDDSIFEKVFDEVSKLEKTFSINEAGTEVDKINEMSGIEPVKVSDDTYKVVKEGLHYAELSDGKFDITIGPLVKLWSIGLPEARVPSQSEIDAVIPLTNYKDVVLNDDDKSIYLTRPNMMLDLGGIAKGYTADVISSILTEEGVNSAIIDLGGNIFAHGSKLSGDSWRIGIQNPSSDRGEIIGALPVKNKSVVTSGIYERYIEQDGVKYHHILNPVTGYPYDNDIAGVSIISDKSSTGDALSTTLFALGVEDGLKFIETLPDVDAIFITKNNEVYLTSGVKEIFELTDSTFKIMN